VTFRHEFESPWIGRPHVTFLSLNRLPQRDIDVMIDGVVGNKSMPASIRRDIIERTDGIPLFVEEMTKAVLEAESESAAATIAAPVRAAAFAVPATLHASLMARLDRLGPAKEVAQTGAAIGREFSHSLLTAVASKPEVELNAALDRLIAAGLLFRQGVPPYASYLFKHALVQDTAYESLLKSRRQILHTRIAETLREKFANTAAEPELVAHHFTQAGLTESAIEWWGKAGDQALRRSAFKEAIAHLGKAIEMTEKLGAATPAAPQIGERLRLQIAYGNALISARGYQAQETTAAFARARELAANIEDAAERYSAYYGAWASSYVRGELAPMRELAEEFLHDAECRPGLPEAGVAHRVFGGTCWFQGDFVAARRHLEQALAGYDPERDRSLAFQFGQDVVVSAMINLAHVLWPLGELGRARRLVEEALTLAMRSGHVPTMAYGQYYKCLFEAVARNAARALPHAGALVDLSREHGLPFFLTSGTFYYGWTRWHAGDREAGMAEMRQGIALAREQGIGLAMPLYGLLLAEAEAEAGQIDAGLIRLDELLPEIERTGQCWIEAQLNRVRGELLIRHRPAETAAAEDALKRSVAVARRQQTKTFELQAATSLARLRRDQGKRDEARDLLAPVYGWFTEGFDTRDLKEAEALLGEFHV
jgi:predicted ATPase